MIYSSTVRQWTPQISDTSQTVYLILEHYYCPDTNYLNNMIYSPTVRQWTPRISDTSQLI